MIGATKKISKPLLTKKTLISEKKPGIIARVETIEMKTRTAIITENFPWDTMVSMIHLKSIRKNANPKKKPQIAALCIAFSLCIAVSNGVIAIHATRSAFQGGKASDKSRALVMDSIKEPIMPGIQEVLNPHLFGLTFQG